MVYLIGVEHKIQGICVGGDETPDQIEYRSSLERAIEQYDPTVVAEEYSEDALKMWTYLRGTPYEYFTKRITDSKGVKHLPCDTGTEMKCGFGIQGTAGWRQQISCLGNHESYKNDELLPEALDVIKDFPLRENYWLEELKDVLHEDVIFVCGDYHVDTFSRRLHNKGIKTQIVAREIGMPTDLIERLIEVRKYVSQNAQRIEDAYQEILRANSGKIRSPYCLGVEEVADYEV
jgi:hypothetical protein